MVAFPEGTDTRRGTCEVCGRQKKLGRFGEFSWRCIACYDLTPDEMAAMQGERLKERHKRAARARRAYPCVGGPLDGELATSDDFLPGYASLSEPTWSRDEGMYAHLASEYLQYNSGARASNRVAAFPPPMIWIHRSLLGVTASPRDR